MFSSYLKKREFKNSFFTHCIRLVCFFVIGSIFLVFLYLTWEVLPLFLSPQTHQVQELKSDTSVFSHAILEKRGQAAAVFQGNKIRFIHRAGTSVSKKEIEIPSIFAQYKRVFSEHAWLDIHPTGFSLASIHFNYRYHEQGVTINPLIKHPYGKKNPLKHTIKESVFQKIQWNFLDGEEHFLLAGIVDRQFLLWSYKKENDFLSEEVSIVPEFSIQKTLNDVDFFLFDEKHFYFIQKNGRIQVYELKGKMLVLLNTYEFDVPNITSAQFLSGKNSIILGDEWGGIHQVSKISNHTMDLIRSTKSSHSSPILNIVPEHNKRNFFSFQKEALIYWNSTSGKKILEQDFETENTFSTLFWSDRADDFLLLNRNTVQWYELKDNQYSEISLDTLFSSVWYEGYAQPDYIWQSSSSSDNFEPKMSVSVLLFGTLKAVLYAMLFALPLAFLTAIYVSFFAPQRIRSYLKAFIEIMEAIPTVIIGFLAALWLAPILKEHLLSFFIFLFCLPVFICLIIVFGRKHLQHSGFAKHLFVFSITILACLLCAWLLSSAFESLFLNGRLFSVWLQTDLGINYTQRNALLVGIAMGFAIIPTIFTIAEDALSAVPAHLTQGSLALGATLWQTIVKVAIPFSSPALFSSAMVGLGRGVGETMIVLMAAGNTPIMEWNIFEGMRTLSANIAIEIGEAELGGSHFRVLFLTALLLFLLTFFFNTISEVVRQRLRYKYGESK